MRIASIVLCFLAVIPSVGCQQPSNSKPRAELSGATDSEPTNRPKNAEADSVAASDLANSEVEGHTDGDGMRGGPEVMGRGAMGPGGGMMRGGPETMGRGAMGPGGGMMRGGPEAMGPEAMGRGAMGRGAMGPGGRMMRGGPGGMGRGGMSGMRGDMATLHSLFNGRGKISRTIKNLPNGAETLTESDDDEIASLLQEHVPAMEGRVSSNSPLPPMTFHPLFKELIKHARDVVFEYDETDRGVKITYTSDDPYVVLLIQEHAKLVSRFIKNGMDEIHAPYTLPESESDGESEMLEVTENPPSDEAK